MHVACCIGNLMLRPFQVLRGNEGTFSPDQTLDTALTTDCSSTTRNPLGSRSRWRLGRFRRAARGRLVLAGCVSKAPSPKEKHALNLLVTEEVSTFFPGSTLWQSFVCAIVAAVTLQYIDPFNTGKLVLFEVTTSQVWRGFELIPWTILGVLGGMWGAWFIHLNEVWERFRKASGLHRWPVTEVAALALFTAVVSYLVVFMRIPSSELVVNLFQDCSSAVDTYGLCE